MSAGSPAVRIRWLPVPDAFVTRTLVEADSAATIKVALHVLWRVARRPSGLPPALREEDLAADTALLRSLAACAGGQELPPVLSAAVDRLVASGWLVEERVTARDGGMRRWLWPDVPESRRHHQRWREGEVPLPELPVAAGRPPAERPNIYALYEENIGLLTPMITEALAEAEAGFPAEWIEDAIGLAVAANVRRWSYVRAILDRWSREGRGDETDRRRAGEGRGRDAEGPYGDYIQH